MEKKNHIDDEKEFEKLQTLLKELPKIEAPDNFEYNLMTRIQNKNFDIKSEKKKSIFFWVYTPTFALVASVILVFFVFTDSDIDTEDTWNSQPKLRPELQSSQISNSNTKQIEEREIISKQSASKRKISSKVNPSVQMQKPTNEKKDVAANQKSQPVYPFDKNESVDLDQLLEDESPTLNNGIVHPQLAGESEASKSKFSGFFIRQVEAEAKKESLRVREDSLKQLEDSINQNK